MLPDEREKNHCTAQNQHMVGIVLEWFFPLNFFLSSTLMADYEHFLHRNTYFN